MNDGTRDSIVLNLLEIIRILDPIEQTFFYFSNITTTVFSDSEQILATTVTSMEFYMKNLYLMVSNQSILKKQKICSQSETFDFESQECSKCPSNFYSPYFNSDVCFDCAELDLLPEDTALPDDFFVYLGFSYCPMKIFFSNHFLIDDSIPRETIDLNITLQLP